MYFKEFNEIDQAIQREKEIKKWRREKKEVLIASKNPEWSFLNDEIMALCYSEEERRGILSKTLSSRTNVRDLIKIEQVSPSSSSK